MNDPETIPISLPAAERTLRPSGLKIMGDIPWGTHFCQFYQSRQDLIDVLVPYFTAGLENNEHCMWIVSEPLGVEDAKDAMRRALPNFDSRLARGQIAIIPYGEWYLKDGVFDPERVLQGWVDALKKAQDRGYEGLRLTGNTFWLEKDNWARFADYEKKVDDVIGNYRMIALCTYSADKCGAPEVIDVVTNHRFALIKRDGQWKMVESSEGERLGKKIEELARSAARTIHENEDRYRNLFTGMTEGFALHEIILDEGGKPGDYRFLDINPAFEQLTGLRRADVVGRTLNDVLPGEDPKWLRLYGEVALTGKPAQFENYSPVLKRHYRAFAYRPAPLQFAVIFTDVTAGKRAEEELRNSASRFKLLADSAEEFLQASHPQATVQSVCRKVMGYLGCDVFFNFLAQDEPKGLVLNAYFGIPPEEAKRIEKLDYGVAVCGCVARDGRRIVAEHIPSISDERTELVKSYGVKAYACHPLLAEGGKVIGTLSFGSRSRETFSDDDLSLMKAAAAQVSTTMTRLRHEEALRQSEEKFRTLFETMPHGIVLLDAAGRITSANPAAETILGVPIEQMRERELLDARWKFFRRDGSVFPGEENPATAALKTGKPVKNVVVGVFNPAREDTAWINLDAVPRFKRGSDSPIGVYVTFDEITERKRALEALERSRSLLNSAQRLARVGSWELDMVANRLAWSDEVFNLFEVEREKFGATYEAFVAMIHPADRADVERVFADSLKSRQPYEVVHRILLPGDRIKIVHELGEIIFSEAGRPLRCIGSVQDVTEQKLAEDILRKRQDSFKRLALESQRELVGALLELEKSKRLSDIGALAATVAHELRNPLAVIRMAAYNIRRKAADSRLDSHIENVEKKVAQSEQIIDNLLVYSHIKPPQIKCAKLTEILKESVDLAANRLCRRRVKVKHNLAESNGIVVQADPHQIKEVFDNILSNASDAVQEKKGLVTIRVQPAARETVRIVFKDNGVGMSPENLKRAFEPFFTTKSKGTGLGLAVCRQIVDLHDGTIGMVSRLGRGTSVTVSLRRAPAGNNGEAPKLPAAPSGAGARRRKRGDTKG